MHSHGRSRHRLAVAAISAAFVVAGCGSDDEPSVGGTDPAVTTTVADPATTDSSDPPPATDEPAEPSTTTADPATTAPEPSPPLPENPVDVDDGGFGSIEELADAAESIVVGTVTAEVSLGRLHADEDPRSDEYLGLTVRVESTLKGAVDAEVLLGWDAYLVDDSGVRLATNVMNGVPTPQVGDQLLLFLRPVDAAFAEFLDGFPTHSPVALDGIGFVEGGTVAITDISSPETAVLLGKTIADVTAVL